MKDLEELLNTIYIDIRKRNTERSPHSVPLSEDFYDEIEKRYSLIPYAIPTLFKILADSHKIFSFTVVEADRKERIRRVDGFVVTEGNIIKSLLEYYGDELIRAYSHEFSMKYSIERIIKEFFPKLNEYNNTHLGKTANIVIHLMSFQSTLERNIMQYGQKWQENQLRIEIEKRDPIEFFIGDGIGKTETGRDDEDEVTPEKSRRAIDAAKYEEFKKYMSKNSIEKAVIVYGVEFYTRVCFREYQFTLMKKLIEDGLIQEREDLMIIKKLLQKTRAHSDQDLNLQKYAHDINDLEKLINGKLKQDGKQ